MASAAVGMMPRMPFRRRRDRRTLARRLLPLLAGLAGPQLAWAQAVPAAEFERRCSELAGTARIDVLFKDAPITWDTRRDVETLGRLSKAPPNAHHMVLGLTQATPEVRMNVSHQSLTHTDGRVCMSAQVQISLGLSKLTVYLASNLTNACRRRIVEAHEAEHVRIWRNHLRAGARLAEAQIRRQLTFPFYADGAAAAEDELRRRLNAVVLPIGERIAQVADAAQREIDTPASYQQGMARMRACPS
jgi:hypothetical protein